MVALGVGEDAGGKVGGKRLDEKKRRGGCFTDAWYKSVQVSTQRRRWSAVAVAVGMVQGFPHMDIRWTRCRLQPMSPRRMLSLRGTEPAQVWFMR